MKKTNTIVLLTLMTLISFAFTNEKPEQRGSETYYYYAYVYDVSTSEFDHIYVTPLKTITINEDKYYPINEHALANQLGDYMESKYNGRYYTEGRVFKAKYIDKSKALYHYRERLKLTKRKTEVHNFSYTPSRR